MGRNPLIAKINRRKKINLSLPKRTHASYNSTVTTYYERIEAKYHLIKMSGDYKYKQIEEKIGEMDFDNKYFRRKNKIYTAKYNININGFELKIFTGPLKPGMPQVSIAIIPPDGIPAKEHEAFLRYMDDLFPTLKLSSIENTIDIFFIDPTGVEEAYESLKRNVFVPRKRSKPVIYQNSIKIGNHKIYKRGNDKNRINRGYNRENLDRVRMEYTSKRRELKKNGINYLSDMLRLSKYYYINKNKWNFKNFDVIRSKKLPGELDAYTFDGSFQGEYFAAKGKVKNRSKRLADSRGFRDLKYDLLDAMKLFDPKW
jgi:hypothetical protein